MSDEPAIIWFGDGTTAHLHSIPNEFYKDEEGRSKIKIRLRPGTNLVKKYNLKSNDMDDRGTIEKTYTKEHFVRISEDGGRRRIMLLCTFNGETTAMTEKFKEYLNQIKYLEKENQILIFENVRLKRSLKIKAQSKLKDLKDDVEIAKLAKKIYGGTVVEQAPADGNVDVGEY